MQDFKKKYIYIYRMSDVTKPVF